MSIPRVRDGGLVLASEEYKALRFSMDRGDAITLDHAAYEWPEFDALRGFRAKKRGVARELANAEACEEADEGTIKCFTAVLPRQKLVSDKPVAVVRSDRPGNCDFDAVAQLFDSRLPEVFNLDKFNVYAVEEYAIALHRHLELTSNIVRGSELPRLRLGWFLRSSSLACLVNLREIYLLARNSRCPSVVSGTRRRIAQRMQTNYPFESEVDKGRPFAIFDDRPNSMRVCVLGSGLNGPELQRQCERVSHLLLRSSQRRHPESDASLLIEIW